MELSVIAKRFVNPHFDITNSPTRALIKQGTLTRQSSSRFKKMERECLLFNDIFVFANKLDKDDNGKLEMKQVIELGSAVLDDRTGHKTGMKHAVVVRSADRDFVVGAKTQEDKDAWVAAIQDAIQQNNPLAQGMTSGASHAIHLGTVFSAVVLHNLEDVMKCAKQRGFDINSRDDQGSTALHLAVEQGLNEIAEFLLQHKAEPALPNVRGLHALHLAAAEGHNGVVQLLLTAKCDPNEKDDNTQSVLAVAISEGMENVSDIVETLASSGADVRERVDGGKSLLHVAAEQNDSLTVAVLIKHGLSLTDECDRGQLPLHYAAQAGSMSVCEVLLGEGAAPNIRDQQLNTPLHLARDVKVGCALVKHGARLDLKNIHDLPASTFF